VPHPPQTPALGTGRAAFTPARRGASPPASINRHAVFDPRNRTVPGLLIDQRLQSETHRPSIVRYETGTFAISRPASATSARKAEAGAG